MYESVDKRLLITSKRFMDQKVYWEEKLSGGTSRTPVFCPSHCKPDRPVMEEQDDRVEILFSHGLSTRLMTLSNRSDLTIYVALLSALKVLMYRYSSGSGDTSVISPVFEPNVSEETINRIVVIRDTINSSATFKDVLLQVTQSVREAYEHQDYPFDELVESLANENILDIARVDTTCLLKSIHSAENVPGSGPGCDNRMVLVFERKADALSGEIRYNTGIYEKNFMRQISGHFTLLLEQLVSDVNVRINEVVFLSQKERKQLIFDFNHTQSAYPRDMSICRLFEEQAEKTPDSIAFVGSDLNNKYHVIHLSYKQLNRESDRLACVLREKGVTVGSIAAIMVEPSAAMIYGILGILKAGAAYMPIALDYPEERKQYMLADSAAQIVLTHQDLTHDVSRFSEVDAPPSVSLRSSDLAYVIYTSGSTGQPKGVMVEHKNVVRLVQNTNYIEFEEPGRLLRTGALEFDASTFEIWGALLNGWTLYSSSREDIINPGKLKTVVRKYRIDTMWLTAPLFNHLSSEDIEIFDGLKNLLVGGDVLSPVHINRVRQRFSRLNIINGYGPTENTTFSTTFRIQEESVGNIPIGTPIANSTAYIVDRWRQLVPVGVVGELYVGGDGVARGYLNNPQLTDESFSPGTGGERGLAPLLGRLYRTGDLARRLADGNIEFLGRADFQVKIRGFRIELEEIKHRLLKHEAVEDAVVVCRNGGTGDKYLCAYIVGARGTGPIDVDSLRKHLSRSLPDYMVPAHFVPMEILPLNRNGKVDLGALPEPDSWTDGENIVEPRNEIEEKLVDIWSDVLDIEKEAISIDSNFFELGGHSLRISILITRIHKAFNVKVELADVFMIQTIRELAEYIAGAETDIYLAIEPAPPREYYALSSAQKRLYFLNRRDLDDTSYNMPMVLVMEQGVNKEKLETAFSRLIVRHESLRTSFVMKDEEPMQQVHDHVPFEMEYFDLTGDQVEFDIDGQEISPRTALIIREFVKPFDLSQAPLMRVGIIKESEKKHILIVDIHHIISDGTSHDLLAREFAALYAGRELPPLRLQYKDFSEWQNNFAVSPEVLKQKEYWLKQFEDHIPLLNLPIDFPRPVYRDSTGVRILFEIEEALLWKLKKLALKYDTTLYTVLLAAYSLLLSKITGQDDLVVGSPVLGRTHADLHYIIGLFANMLPMRSKPREDKYFEQYLEELKETTMRAFENQDFQFDQLVKSLKIERDPGRHPLFDTVLALQNIGSRDEERRNLELLDNVKVKPFPSEQVDVQHDLLLMAEEKDGKLSMMLEYAAALFKRSTIDDIKDYFIEILEQITLNDNFQLKDIHLSHDAVTISGLKEEEGDFIF